MFHGKTEAVKELLEAGVDINSKNTITKQTALQLAVLSEQKEVVDLLIQHNVAIDMYVSNHILFQMQIHMGDLTSP